MSCYMSPEAEVCGKAAMQARSELSLVSCFTRVIVPGVYNRELRQITYGAFYPSDVIHWVLIAKEISRMLSTSNCKIELIM